MSIASTGARNSLAAAMASTPVPVPGGVVFASLDDTLDGPDDNRASDVFLAALPDFAVLDADGDGLPDAAAVKVALAPAVTVCAVGWVVTCGADVAAVTVSVAAELVAVLTLLVKTAR